MLLVLADIGIGFTLCSKDNLSVLCGWIGYSLILGCFDLPKQ